MPTQFTAFTNIYNFALIEAALQAFFVAVDGGSFIAPPDESDRTRGTWAPGAGDIAFYTNSDVLVNQAARPRVKSRLHSVNMVPRAFAIDANNNVREKAWTGAIDIGVVTAPNYNQHVALRSQVLAILPMCAAGVIEDNSLFGTTGLNAILQYHEVSQIFARSVTTDVVPAEGCYMSVIPVQIAFNAKVSAWPAGMVTL